MFTNLTKLGPTLWTKQLISKMALLEGLVLCSVLALAAQATAQHAPGGQRAPGVPSSITSQSFGGRVNHAPGIPASVTGFGSIGPHNPVPFGSRPNQGRNGGSERRRNRDQGGYIYGFAPYYYGGYDYGPAPEGGPDSYSQDQYNGGPTVFDRRGNGNYAPMQDNARYDRSPEDRGHDDRGEDQLMASAAQPEPPPASNQPDTVLVFKDGHKVEVQNYAIVGNTLYDFSEGRRKKIAIAELDLPATAKENDEMGVDFALPSGRKAK